MERKEALDILLTLDLPIVVVEAFNRAANNFDADGFDVAEAAYWIGADYHGGQSDPTYTLTSAFGFKPGPMQRAPSADSVAQMIYEDVASQVFSIGD